jgi:hypothetical protein
MPGRGLDHARGDRVKWSESERQEIVSAAADMLGAGSCLSGVKLLTEAQKVLPQSRRRHSFSLKRIAWFIPAVEAERLRRTHGSSEVVITGYHLDQSGLDNDPYIPVMSATRDQAKATAEALAEIRENHRVIRDAIMSLSETMRNHDVTMRREVQVMTQAIQAVNEQRTAVRESVRREHMEIVKLLRAMLAACQESLRAINNTSGPLPRGRDGSYRGDVAPESVQAAST